MVAARPRSNGSEAAVLNVIGRMAEGARSERARRGLDIRSFSSKLSLIRPNVATAIYESGDRFHPATDIPHARALHRRRPRRPLPRPAAQEGGSGPRRARGRTQPPLRHVRLGRRVLRPDARQSRGGGPADRARDRRFIHSLGRHRRPLPRSHDHVGRPWLLRHRPQAAAQHPAGALRGAGRRAGVRAGRRGRRRRRARIQRRCGDRLRWTQQPHPHALCGQLRAGHRHAPLPFRLAGHA